MLPNLYSTSSATAFLPLASFFGENMLGDCSKIPGQIFENVKQFLTHRVADAQICARSLISWSAHPGRSYPVEMELRAFQRIVVMSSPQYARDYFMQLSSQVRDRFFTVDPAYLHQYADETDSQRSEVLRDEIMRECWQVRTMDKIILFVDGIVGKFFGVQTGATTIGALSSILSSSSVVSTINGDGVDLMIPDTLPYIQGMISPAVQAKADEIVARKARYDALVGVAPIPPEFGDNIMSDAMAIPIFDASHPAVQSGLPALRAAAGPTLATALSHHRTLRHTMDRDNLEAHINAGSSWAPAKCPHCRHPEHGGIRRQYLVIDTGLQDDILAWLRGIPGT